MTLVTNNTYIDNFDSEIKNTIEIGIKNKKAFVERKTGILINRDNIKNIEKYQAYKLAIKLAKQYRN